jgi:hypothetical protein
LAGLLAWLAWLFVFGWSYIIILVLFNEEAREDAFDALYIIIYISYYIII